MSERKARFFSPDEPEGKWVSTEGVDPIRKGVTEILYKIDADLEEFGWDLPPMLFWLYRARVEVPPEAMPPDMSGDYEGFAFRVERVPVPNELWVKVERPANLLFLMCDMIEEARREVNKNVVAADELMGYIFAVEAWGVKPRNREQRRRMDRDSKKHELHLNPDRIEMRVLTAVDTAGELYYMQHERDSIIIELSAEESKSYKGAVPDALRALLAVSRGEADPSK